MAENDSQAASNQGAKFKLVFDLVLHDGSKAQQDFDVPTEHVATAINQLIQNYMQVGYIREENGFIITKRVDEISVQIPSIVIPQRQASKEKSSLILV